MNNRNSILRIALANLSTVVLIAVIAPIGSATGQRPVSAPAARSTQLPKTPQQPDAAQTNESQDNLTTIDELMVQMNSPQFAVRHKATIELSTRGIEAIRTIEKSLKTQRPDFRARSIEVLIAIGADSDSSTKREAILAIQRLAKSKNIEIAEKANRALNKLSREAQRRAAAELVELGAEVQYRVESLNGELSQVPNSLTIGESWEGESKDLIGLSLMSSVRVLNLHHEQFVDEDLRHIANMPNLRSLSIKRAPKLTNAWIKWISKTQFLNTLEVFYCNVDEGCLEDLIACKTLTEIKLYGTRVSPDQIEPLSKKISATIDIRHGAFLGIKYTRGSAECKLSSVVEGAGADKAGLRAGDIIVEMEGKPVTEPPDLTKILREKFAGDKVKAKISRGSENLKVEITLGEWE